MRLATAVRLPTPSFRYVFSKCFFTVAGEIHSSLAIWAFAREFGPKEQVALTFAIVAMLSASGPRPLVTLGPLPTRRESITIRL